VNKPKHYTFVGPLSKDRLIAEVNRLMEEEGWRPLGGVDCVTTRHDVGPLFTQVLIRPVEAERPE